MTVATLFLNNSSPRHTIHQQLYHHIKSSIKIVFCTADMVCEDTDKHATLVDTLHLNKHLACSASLCGQPNLPRQLVRLQCISKAAQRSQRRNICCESACFCGLTRLDQALKLGQEGIIFHLDNLLFGLACSSYCKCRHCIVCVPHSKNPAISEHFNLCVVGSACSSTKRRGDQASSASVTAVQPMDKERGTYRVE